MPYKNLLVIIKMSKANYRNNSMSHFWMCCFFLLLFVLCFNLAFSQSIVNTLPGFHGNLPFKLETGYIGVGEDEEIQLFYYFIESEKDPLKDPLIVWHPGGCGCTGLNALTYEHIGPVSFDVEALNGSLPSLLLNPYSWTKVANIIFLDSPVGTGFSYSTTIESSYTSDKEMVHNVYEFLQKWLLKHPSFMKNRLYIGGDSYGGKMAPMIATHISKQNEEAFVKPRLNLKGYITGNAGIDGYEDEKITFAHRLGLISDEYYELAENSCNGEYVNPDPTNSDCVNALQLINMCISDINVRHILEPNCQEDEDLSNNIILQSQRNKQWCRNHDYVVVHVWANDPSVQEALHIRKGTKTQWLRCNESIPFENYVEILLPYHQYLTKKNYEALLYSGDHDMTAPYLGTLRGVGKLNLTVYDNWRPWFVNDQIAGYTKKYVENEFSLTYTTIKGAGHLAPEYKPKECFAMIQRWLSGYIL